MRTLILVMLLFVSLLGCNSRDEVANEQREKFVPPWEAPKSAARAAKEQVEGSSRDVDKQLADMDDDQEEGDSE